VGDRQGAASSYLDQLQINRDNPPKRLRRKRYCGNSTVSGKREETPAGEVIVGRVHCKTWACEFCGPKRARRYKRAIREQAEKLKLTRLLTLTLDPKKVQGDPWRFINEVFADLRVYWKRKFGEAPRYIRVLEFQKNGNPHFHLLIDRFMPYEWIKDRWLAAGGGFMVDVRAVDLHRVSHYLNKYLTKQMLLSAPLWSRRVTASRGIVLLGKGKGNWQFERDVSIYARWRRALQYCWFITSARQDEEGELEEFSYVTNWSKGP
jgi:hypothetical protein